MNLVVISQCAKNALTETRRVLDQFAERSGHRTWIFESTDEGQKQIRQMLKRSARKNTAVMCYHIKKAGGKEILWLVGNPRRFNESGAVPTNSTGRDLLSSHLENSWQNLQAIKAFSAIAGLFHDVGKANALFQKKLKSAKRSSEPVRHEWISLLIFEAFVAGDDDHTWLKKLQNIEPTQETEILNRLVINKYKDTEKKVLLLNFNPFKNGLKSPIARIIGWLIASHHRLPEIPENEAILDNMDQWLIKVDKLAPGNSPQINNDDWKPKQWQDVFDFKSGTPIRSRIWCAKASKFAHRLGNLKLDKIDWMQDPFVMHLARLSLMLSDHLYSAQHHPTKAWQDSKVKSYANTVMQDVKNDEGEVIFNKGQLKQKLDEHNIGVANHSFIFPNLLPNLRRDLSSFSYCKPLKKFASNTHFTWQNKAYQLACGLKEQSQQQGFIGFNLASTGRGKTLGNAKIMYALADEKLGCRFSVALGLRTLTLQTGDAFKEKLQLNNEDIAVMIGSQAVLNLHQLEKVKENEEVGSALAGSESLMPLFASHETVHYEGVNSQNRLQRWLSGSDKAQKMLNAPILVSTIDHLIPATDGCRGGKQIAPMLRLLTSDLVLDEPDDFGLEDLPALCRLINWAGMLGARVLLSSATIPPDLAKAAFAAYQDGRKHYRRNCLGSDSDETTLAAWFDEYGCHSQALTNTEQFQQQHSGFIHQRIAKLHQQTPLQNAQIVDVEYAQDESPNEPHSTVKAMARSMAQRLPLLQKAHAEQHPDKQGALSLGLVRMANIKQLIAVARALLTSDAPADLQLHMVIYHSRLPMIIRSNLEKQLDALFNRETPDAIWQHELIDPMFKSQPNKEHMVLVLASPVCEVGRNWDADFAICEPSSFRSFIQLAGRVNRHRRKPIDAPNVILLNQNYKGLTNQQVAFTRPGFENNKSFNLSKPKDLRTKVLPEEIERVSAIPRINRRSELDYCNNLVDLEHAHTEAMLFGIIDTKSSRDVKDDHGDNPFKYFAAQWWQNNIHWCQQHQQKLRFRQSHPQQQYFFYMEDVDDELQFCTRSDAGDMRNASNEVLDWFEDDDLQLGQGVHWFYQQDLKAELLALSKQLEMDINRCSEIYSQVTIDEEQRWSYQPALGIYSELSN